MKKIVILCTAIILVTAGCTFDYGETDPSERMMPDLVMINVDYVRVRSAEPIVRFQAERAERYERHSLMLLESFSFEQFGETVEEINVYGRAGNASINISSGDIFMDNGVRLEIETDDITIETHQLDWRDEPRLLSTGEDNVVHVYQSNGTSFTGIGLTADARRRTWEFLGPVSGIFIHNDDEEED
jgi:LPS export ABC transporter protein LptC